MKKSLCIFALGFEVTVISKVDIYKQDFKDTKNEQKNISTIEKEKEEIRIYGQNGFCKWKKSSCA
jgi:hypothetical protein